jgi:hypothetical protein
MDFAPVDESAVLHVRGSAWRAAPRRLRVVVLGTYAFLVAWTAFIYAVDGPVLVACVGLLVLAGVLLFREWQFRRLELRVSAAGLERVDSRSGLRVFVPWQDVTGLRRVRQRSLMQWAIEYKPQPLVPKDSGTSLDYRTVQAAQRRGRGTWFPTALFIGDPPSPEFLATLFTHRPDMLESWDK